MEQAINSAGFDVKRNPQVAFYGGTFTSLKRDLISELLKAVTPFIEQGQFKGIRVSTRPDTMDESVLVLMRRLGVSTVELGTQSMDDHVLKISQRGHRGKDTVNSVRLLRKHGFEVGIQLMPGLPGDSEERFINTVDSVIKLRPDMVRLYPTIVIRGTALAKWYEQGIYTPLPLGEAVRICKKSCIRFEEEEIPVIRIGLMSSPTLIEEGRILAGPWHPAFGFLVRSAMHLDRIKAHLPEYGEMERIKLRVPSREIPLVRGYKNRGVREIETKTGAKVISVVPDEAIPRGEVRFDCV